MTNTETTVAVHQPDHHTTTVEQYTTKKTKKLSLPTTWQAIKCGLVLLVVWAILGAYSKSQGGSNVNGGNSSSAAQRIVRTDLSTAPVPSSMVPAGCKEVRRGLVPVTTNWTSVGTYNGKVLILMGGQAALSFKLPALGPEGYGQPAETGYPLPGAQVFSSLAKIGSKIEPAGPQKELRLPQPTEIFLGPNDEPGQHGQGYQDNQGAWSYVICVPQ